MRIIWNADTEVDMNQVASISGAKRATNLTLSVNLVEQARSLNVNLSRAAEDGIARAIASAKDAQWVERNKGAMDDYNRFVGEQGLILEDGRLF
jgi:antitoxin CcdA